MISGWYSLGLWQEVDIVISFSKMKIFFFFFFVNFYGLEGLPSSFWKLISIRCLLEESLTRFSKRETNIII